MRGLTVQVDVKAEEKLDGSERLTLTVENVESPEEFSDDAKSADAKIANFDDCGIEGLVQDVQATGACIEDNEANKATFAFNVVMAGAYNTDQVYSYAFDSNKSLDGYEITGASIYAGGVDVTPE